MAADFRKTWEQIFGFSNPLQRSGDKIHPIEDGKEFRRQWRSLSDRILVEMKDRLSSTYASSIPSATYDLILRGWSEEVARIWIEGDKVSKDRQLPLTRGQYLFQKWGYLLHVANSGFPRPTWDTELYRAFLLTLLETYLGGSKEQVIEAGLTKLTRLPSDLIELFKLEGENGIDISYQFGFDVTLTVQDASLLSGFEYLLEDTLFLLSTVKPAHTLYQARLIVLDDVGFDLGCLTELGDGYLEATIISKRGIRSRTFTGLLERTLEGVVSDLNLTQGSMLLDGQQVRFNPLKVKLLSPEGQEIPLDQLRNGEIVSAEGWPVNTPLTPEGFLVKDKVTPTSLCESDRLEYSEWNYEDFRHCCCPFSSQSFRSEPLPARLTSYGTVIFTSPHKPLSRGDKTTAPPYKTNDGSGGIRIWYKHPGPASVNVTGKIVTILPAKGQIEVVLEPGVTSLEQVQARYTLEYYFFSQEGWVERELITLAEQILPIIQLKNGPLVRGDGTPSLVRFDQSQIQDLKLFINGIDESERIRFVYPLLGQIELHPDQIPLPTDLIEVSYWFWKNPEVPLLLNSVGRVLNDINNQGSHRFLYDTSMVDNRLPGNVCQPPPASVVPKSGCGEIALMEARYCGFVKSNSSLLNSPTTFTLNTAEPCSQRHKLNTFLGFCAPAQTKDEEPFESIGTELAYAENNPSMDDPARSRLLIAPDTPIHVARDPSYTGLHFFNRLVREGDCDVPLPVCESGLTLGFDFKDTYSFQDPDPILLNNWGNVSFEEGVPNIGSVPICVRGLNTPLTVSNVLASRLNVNPEMEVPLFKLVYNFSFLYRRGLNSRHALLYALSTRPVSWLIEERLLEVATSLLPEEEFLSMSFSMSDYSPEIGDMVCVFLDAVPVVDLCEFTP